MINTNTKPKLTTEAQKLLDAIKTIQSNCKPSNATLKTQKYVFKIAYNKSIKTSCSDFDKRSCIKVSCKKAGENEFKDLDPTLYSKLKITLPSLKNLFEKVTFDHTMDETFKNSSIELKYTNKHTTTEDHIEGNGINHEIISAGVTFEA